jgi:hypothetical protein
MLPMLEIMYKYSSNPLVFAHFPQLRHLSHIYQVSVYLEGSTQLNNLKKNVKGS